MLIPIVDAGDPVLRNPALPVAADKLGTAELRALVESMVETMRDAPGVGLAAPQIGLGLRVIVLEDTEAGMSYLDDHERAERGRVTVPLTAIVNPRLKLVEGAEDTFFEGCLSVPGYSALVPRAREVEVTGLTPDGAPFSWRVSGWPARILQHEFDHLNGTLYVDRMLSRSLCTSEQAGRWVSRPLAEIFAALRIER